MAAGKIDHRGGARPGAGRPPKIAPQIKKAEALARQLSVATKSSLPVVAEAMPELIEAAVTVALGHKLGEPASDRRPDKDMLKYLIDIGIRTINPDELSEGDGASRVLGRALQRATEVEIKQENHYHYEGANARIPRDVVIDVGGTGRESDT